MASPIRIGARASRLSQAQSRQIQARIAAALGAPPEDAERVAPLVLITTTGDRIQDRRLLEAGGKGLFTKEIEVALAAGEIDVAVHSLKDVPSELPPGLVLAAHPEREDPRDAFVSLAHASLDALPKGARLGTASLRRQAQCLFRRPDLDVEMMRGNVDTRLGKLEAGGADAILLALAGLKRLGMADRVTEALDPVEAPPAPGQGALAIQTRSGDVDAPWLEALRHAPTMLAIAAERGALLALEGSCRTAMGAYARMQDGRLLLVVEALTPDGKERWRREGAIDLAGLAEPEAAAHALGLELAGAIRHAAGDRLVFGGSRGMRVWVTRAEPGASATAARLAALGHEPLVAPVIALAPITGATIDLEGVGALAFTSAHGVRAFAALRPERDLAVFVVGDATAEAARLHGFTRVELADGDVAALAGLIARRRGGIDGAVLHPCAKVPAGDLLAALADGGVTARQVALYEARAVEDMPDAAAAALAAGRLDAALVHSPSAGRALAAMLTPGLAAGLSVFALSPACAAPLAGSGLKRLEAAPFPREEALLKLVP